MRLLLSIIIPVYNAEPFLQDCLNSIVCQNPDNIEVIVVNDGSSDGSEHIIRDFCLKYDYIKLINQSNQGVSSARNIALQSVRGEYIAFLDADDMLSLIFFKNIGLHLNQCDILELNGYLLNNSEVITKPIMNYGKGKLNLQETKQRFHQQYQYYLFLRIIKRSLFINIQFNNQITFCEDALFLTECYNKAVTIKTIDKPVYLYRQHEDNTTKTNQDKNIQSLTSLLAIIKHRIDEAKGEEKVNFIALLLNMLHRKKSMQVVHKRSVRNDRLTKDCIKLCKNENYLNISQEYINPLVKVSIKYPRVSNFLIFFKSVFSK